MKRSLPFTLILGILLFTYPGVFGQNPVLTGTCTGKQLTVTGNTSAIKIEWIRNGSIIEQTNWPHLGNPVTVAGKEGISGGDNDHLFHPKKLFATPAGDVYVVDWGNGRVQKWSPPYTTGVTVASGLDWGDDVHLENNGNILVSEHWGQRVGRWPGNTTLIDKMGGADGMCTDAAGRLYLVEYVGHRIWRFPANSTAPATGTLVAGTGGPGNALNQLSYATDVQVDGNGQIYVLDAGNSRILRFPSNSSPGTNGTVIASGLDIRYPHSFSVDASGTVFVTTSSGIQMIEPGGTPLLVSDIFAYGIHSLNNNQVYVSSNYCVKRLSLLPPADKYIPFTPGAYTARIYYKDGTVKTSNVVNVQLTPAAPVATGTTLVCPGNTLTLQATSPVAGATYQWIGPLGYTASGANPSIGAVAMAHSGNYIVTLRDPGGCVSAPDTVAITVAQPVPSIAITANTVRYFCPGIPVTFTPTPVNGGPAPAYQWKKNGATVGTGSTYTTTTLNNGDVFTCVMTSNAPCASPATVTSNAITMSSSAAPVLTAPAACVGATISVNSPLPLRQMAWYHDGVYVEDAPNKLNGIVIAGGNGAGSQTNQLNSPRAITRDAAGNLYVIDNLNFRVLKFPPNATSATNGVVIVSPTKRAFTKQELQDFFDYADDRVALVAASARKGWLPAYRDATMFKVAYSYGLRFNELRHLQTVDFSRNARAGEFGRYGVVQVRYGKAKKGSPPKRRSVLTVFRWSGEVIADWLAHGQAGMGAGIDLFPSERGALVAENTLLRRFRRYCRELEFSDGLDLHSLRRSYATHLIEDGWDAKFVQDQMGHDHASTTSLYTCVSSDYRVNTLRRALDSTVASALSMNEESE